MATAGTMEQRYRVGACPACQADLYVSAVIEIDAGAILSPPDPRQEGEVTLKGKVTGATVMTHDCRKKVIR